MRKRNNKVIVNCKLLGSRNLGTFFNGYSQQILSNDIFIGWGKLKLFSYFSVK